jgi:hypothetical protein
MNSAGIAKPNASENTSAGIIQPAGWLISDYERQIRIRKALIPICLCNVFMDWIRDCKRLHIESSLAGLPALYETKSTTVSRG